jgi:membrane-associated phospholipid phosphatase
VISLGRISLGLHSWNQVLVGLLVSCIFISLLTKRRFIHFISATPAKTLMKMTLAFGAFSLLVQVAMFFVNRKDNRFDEEYWKP